MVGRHRIPIIPLSDRRYCLRLLLGRRAISTPSDPNKTAAGATDAVGAREDAYRQLQNLDFMTAAKILFTTPPKKKKFGLDFHLVQLFFACMPSLAVYLVAQYARYEIRRMEAEVELKKKQAEEEEKAKEAELGSIEEGSPDSELSKVMVRLDALEETVKEIVDEKKKIPHDDSKKDREANNNSDPQSKSKAGEPTPDSSKETAGSSSPWANAPPDDCKKDKQ